jgi:hypothetical protein
VGTGRVEAFSDGVVAIIITIMVLEMKVPHGTDVAALAKLWPVFLSYVLSFVYVGIYWNNHHHLFTLRARERCGVVGQPAPPVLAVADPFRHRLDGREPFRRHADGVVRRRAALRRRRLPDPCSARSSPPTATRRCSARRARSQGRISAVCYAVAIPSAFVTKWIAGGLYALVAMIWLVPDRRIERVLNSA